MRVKDCMTKQVISVGAGEPVSVAARLMARYNLGALPVRGTDGQLEGNAHRPGYRAPVYCCGAKPQGCARAGGHDAERRGGCAGHGRGGGGRDHGRAAGAAAAGDGGGRLVGMVSLADLSRRPDYMMEAAEALEDICADVRHMDGQEL